MAKGRGTGGGGRGNSTTPTPRAPRPTPQSSVQRVLIIGPSNIGDAILANDVIVAVRERFPGAHLALVVGERARALFADDPRIQTLVDTSQFDSPLGRLKLTAALWRFQPRVVVDLRHTFYPLVLKPLAAWRYLRQPPKTMAHMRERHLWKLRAQVPQMQAAWRAGEGAAFPVSAKDVSQVDGLRKRWGLQEAARLVIVCPGARSHIKRWTAEGFARVADRLISDDGASVVFSGEPQEEPLIAEVLSLMRQRAHSAVGLTTIRQLGALMRHASLVITNDSASLHLACAFEAPTLAIFGPTDARKYGPTSARHRVIRRRLFCAPCEQSLCRFHHECMRFIGADEVYDAARALLQCGVRSSECGTGQTS